jgi:hypothetical protein
MSKITPILDSLFMVFLLNIMERLLLADDADLINEYPF